MAVRQMKFKIRQLTFKLRLGKEADTLGGFGGRLGKNINIDINTNIANPNST